MNTNYSLKHLKTILNTLFLSCVLFITKANTYYSVGSLSVSSTLSWRDAIGTSPTGFNLTDTFIIKATHSMYVGSNWKVTGVNSCIIIGNGGILKANDSINVNTSTTFQIKDGGSYIHMNNSFAPTSIFNGIEVFEARSNVEINNWYDYKTPITVNTFGNLKITYNPSDIWNQENNISLIQGNFFLDNRSRNAFQFANNSNHTVTINKNFIIKSGVFNFSGAYSKIYRLNIKGGFIQNGGILSHQSPSGILGIFTMNFTGDSSFIYRTGGTYRTLKINYSVDTNAKFYMTRRMQIPIGRSFSVSGTLLCDTFTLFGSGSFYFTT
jgi:hypothetical protein